MNERLTHPADIAQEMYNAYVRQAMGVTYDGKQLPTWHELGTNRQDCWIAALYRAAELLGWTKSVAGNKP